MTPVLRVLLWICQPTTGILHLGNKTFELTDGQIDALRSVEVLVSALALARNAQEPGRSLEETQGILTAEWNSPDQETTD